MEENRKIFLSILIPTYNRYDSVIRAIESVGTPREDIEIVVVDNNSDETIYIKLEEKTKEFPHVKLFRNDKNIGMTKNFNRCISLSSGQWMGLLCSDDNYLPGAIDYSYDLLKSEKQPCLVIQDPTISEPIERLPGGRDTASKLRLPLASGNFWHKEIVEQLGGFDERLKYSPDAEFWYRLASQFPIMKVKGNFVQYNNDGSNYMYTTWREADFLEQIELLSRQNLKHIHGENFPESFVKEEINKGKWATLLTILGDTASKKDKQDIYEKYRKIAKGEAVTSEHHNQLNQIECYRNTFFSPSENPAGLSDEKQSQVPITFMVGVYNEEHRIRHVLDHATRWADEVIIVNKSSTDRTKEICLEYGNRVRVVDVPFTPKGHDDVVALSKLPSNDWIFFGPASEIPTRRLIERCREILSETKGELDLVIVPRKYYSFGIHDRRSPWSISYFPFLVNRKKTIITNTIHVNFRPSNPHNIRAIDFSDDCCVYHMTHPSAKDYMLSMTDYFESEAASCADPDAKIQECFANMARYEQQLREAGEPLLGHYFAWPIYWLGTALFVWEKKRRMDVAKFYQDLRDEVLKKEWLDFDTTSKAASPDLLNKDIVRDEGDKLFNQKKYAKAKKLYEEYLKTNPDDAGIRSLLKKTESVLEKIKKMGRAGEKKK